MNAQTERDREEQLRFSGFYDWLNMCDLTQWQYEDLLDEQAGRCFVCNEPLCDSTNLVDLKAGSAKLHRALLCKVCMDRLENQI